MIHPTPTSQKPTDATGAIVYEVQTGPATKDANIEGRDIYTGWTFTWGPTVYEPLAQKMRDHLESTGVFETVDVYRKTTTIIREKVS